MNKELFEKFKKAEGLERQRFLRSALNELLKDLEIHPIEMVVFCALEMEWLISIENQEDQDEPVTGMAIGTEEYMEKYFPKDEAI